ncbi:hypothetical protein R5R35_010431 [Gryllus longicercus]|uniref:ER membrane protein complex subunit 1 n=1 Tax=Gryllus longicercus TaxID=2509291 RepID=A0AAN9VTT1_9ORTH
MKISEELNGCISRMWLRSPIVCLALLLIHLNLSYGLYEDQIGKFDWRQMYVGHVKFAEFDTVSSVKKVFVSTEENVVAALNLKSGNIIWRQVLEKKEQGTIHFMNITSEAVITVSGTNPVNVRGWDLNGGFLLWDWSFPLHVFISSEEENKWFLSDTELKLYHISLGSEIIVKPYELTSGRALEGSKLPLPLASKPSCVVAAPYIACIESVGGNPILHTVSITAVNSKPVSKPLKPLIENTEVTLESVHGSQPLVSVTSSGSKVKYLFLIEETGSRVLPYQVERSAKLVQDSLRESNILLQLLYTNEWFDVLTSNLLTGEPIPDVTSSLKYPHDRLGPPTAAAAVCTPRKDKGLGCRVLFSTTDHAVGMFHYPGKLIWVREEALASVVAVEMLDLPVSDTEAAIEKEFDHKEMDLGVSSGFGGMFTHRLLSQTLQLRLLILSILGLGDPPSAGQRAGLVRDEFGLHKMIVIATGVGKLFGIDNLSGEIVWRRRLENVASYSSQNQMILYVQRTTRHFPHPAQCALLARHKVSGEGVIFTFNPITGQPAGSESVTLLGYQIQQSMLLAFTDDNFLRGILLLDQKEQLHVLPSSAHSVAVKSAGSTFIFTADKNTGILAGYSLLFSNSQKLEATRVWEVKLTQGKQRLTAVVSKSPVERVHSQGRVLGDRSVLYKYINPNLVAVVTQGFDPVHKNFLNLYLVDVVSGSVVFSISHKKAREPVHIVHSENWVLYSYFSDKSRRTEIVTLELYEGKVQSNTTAFSSVASPIQPIVDQQAYILPGNIVAMKETITEKGITSKHILVALANGGVLELPWMFVDPRRPITVTPEMREEGVIPYMPELPVPSESIINYNQTVQRVQGIHTAPSGLESTCLVLVYGLDLYYTRVAPSKTFDVLKEDFDHFLISAVLLGLTVVSYITRKLASRKALKQAWK